MNYKSASYYYRYIRNGLADVVLIQNDQLPGFSERHKISIAPKPAEGFRPGEGVVAGSIIELQQGLPGPRELQWAREALQENERLYFYWPGEGAVECVDGERLKSIGRHVKAFDMLKKAKRTRHFLAELANKVAGKYRRSTGLGLPVPAGVSELIDPAAVHARTMRQLDELLGKCAPVPLPFDALPTAQAPLPGTGVYFRLDFWAPITSGGSYGHTCYVAKNLARGTERFVAFMANRYSLLDEMGLRQQLVEPISREGNETNIIKASDYFHEQLHATVKSLRPSYIYERICLGNFTAARLSQELKIPYIVEYNGSEISMRRSFDGSGYEFEDLYLKAEELAFRQATLISVVSEPIRDDLVRRGIDPARILVNPNGADPEAYAPALPEEKDAIRAQLGFAPDDCVIGFSGTFGGWHGVDILADSLPLICARADNARFLMIGDGNFKHLVDKAIADHGLQRKVVCVGRVPQTEGARLLRACDIFVSPHNSHMVDSKFFGSPTKIFEYMAMGAGIVASALEQIGEVLSPGLRAADLKNGDAEDLQGEAARSRLRALLCEPGNLDEFVDGVVFLARHPRLAQTLGENARQAMLDHYSWERHVETLWKALAQLPGSGRENAPALARKLETGDSYKDEVQNQWDNDACGSHYVKIAQRHTLDWYKEVEQYRYEQYAPWMAETMEFAGHAGEKVLEIGAGIGTDLAQFASHGALVTDVDLSSGHLELARENFRLRGLQGEFIHHDAETLPFEDDTFDVVYSNGVIHHTPNTVHVVKEMLRVLKPGGKAIVMVYAENSLHYWLKLFYDLGVKSNKLNACSMGEIMSETVEISENGARPLVKVYTPARLQRLFADFEDIDIVQRQLTPGERPGLLRWIPAETLGKVMGWNLVIKARKPRTARVPAG